MGRPATVVTGATEGIGRELARRFARRGEALVLIARSVDALETAAAEIARETGANVLVLALDLVRADPADVLTRFLRERGLWADVLINNAAIGLGGGFAEQDEVDLARLVDLDIKAVTQLTRRFLPDMCVRGRGGILNVASLAGYSPGPYQAAYYAAKAYVIALTTAVAHEVAGQGVRVCVLAPGPVETRFHERMGAETALYRQVMPGMRPRGVARSAWRGFMLGHRVILPGLMARPMAIAMRVLPDAVVLPFVGLLLKPRGGQPPGGRGPAASD